MSLCNRNNNNSTSLQTQYQCRPFMRAMEIIEKHQSHQSLNWCCTIWVRCLRRWLVAMMCAHRMCRPYIRNCKCKCSAIAIATMAAAQIAQMPWHRPIIWTAVNFMATNAPDTHTTLITVRPNTSGKHCSVPSTFSVRWANVHPSARTHSTISSIIYFRSNLSSMATMADDRSLKFTDSYLTSTISTTSGLGSNYTTNTSGSGSTQPPTPSPRRKTSSTSFKELVELPETEPNDSRVPAYISSRDYISPQTQQYGVHQQSSQTHQLYANDDNLARHRNFGYFGNGILSIRCTRRCFIEFY